MSRVLLSDICSDIVDCVNKTAPAVDFETPYKMLRTSNIRNGQIFIDDLKSVTQEVYEKWNRRLTPKSGDIILTREAPLGEVGMLRDWKNLFLGQRLMLYRIDESKANSKFVLYSFQYHDIQSQIRALASGSTVQHMRVPDAEKITIELPSRKVQDQTATVLSLYEELIYNNNRRIAILEEMAQRLYREWFVHFRFPGHENVEMVDSELGMIPEGWIVENADEIISTQYGYTETANDKKVGPKYVRGTDINKSSFITWATVPYCQITDEKFSRYQLNVGDVLIIRMADPGKIGIIEKDVPAVFASYLIRLAPINKQLTPYYLFYMASHSPFQNFVLGASTGATRKSISAETIKEAKILVPPMAIQELFDKRIFPMRQMINLLLDKTENLRKTRDLLLPRLISGDIDVSNIEM